MKELSPVMRRYLAKLQKREISIMSVPTPTFLALMNRGLVEFHPDDAGKPLPWRVRLSEAGKVYWVEA